MENFSIFTVAPGKNDPPLPPYVRVYLYHSPDHYEDKEGRIVLSIKLMNEMEIDVAIDGLIQELEKNRKKAKKDLQEEKERLQNQIVARRRN
jgi:hypothetical protein